MIDNDDGGLIPDVDETFAFIGATLIACGSALLGLGAGAILWAVTR